jgi:hypothetical protein
MIVICLAPFQDSGTKFTITGLENFRVEWVSSVTRPPRALRRPNTDRRAVEFITAVPFITKLQAGT